MKQLAKLPAAYEEFLKHHDDQTQYIFDDTDGWRLYTIDELAEVMGIDRENVLTIYQMKAFVKDFFSKN